jgi:hypothetical protein
LIKDKGLFKKRKRKHNRNKKKKDKHEKRSLLKKIINKNFKKLECSKCGESDVKCLCFHYRKGKADISSKKLYEIINIKKFKKELLKCIILCANCHLKEYSKFIKRSVKKNKQIKQRVKDKEKKKEFIFNYKKKSGCKICDTRDPICLTFHHVDPNNKVENMNRLLNSSWVVIKEEIAKCMILCANCHIKLHNGLF